MNRSSREHRVDPADLFLPPTRPIEITALDATQIPVPAEPPAPD
jgi:hypothetical protein